jgi:hypothetical protein
VRTGWGTGFVHWGCAAPSETVGTADAELPQRSLRIEGLRALTVAPHAFKVWLLDQFGVLHDGKQVRSRLVLCTTPQPPGTSEPPPNPKRNNTPPHS